MNEAFDWSEKSAAVTSKWVRSLAKDYRWDEGYIRDYLLASGKLGRDEYFGQPGLAFPIEYDGKVVASHIRFDKPRPGQKKCATWPRISDRGIPMQPYVLGDLARAREVHITEGEKDAITIHCALGLRRRPLVAVLATCGASNVPLAKRIPPKARRIIIWVQNDQGAPKWCEQLRASLTGRDMVVAKTPAPHKDVTEWWSKGHSTRAELEQAFSAVSVPVENVEDAPREAAADWPDASHRPCYRLHPQPFVSPDGKVRAAGVYFHDVEKKSTGPSVLIDERLCAPLAVAARTSDRDHDNHGRLLEYVDTDGVPKKWAMPMELLAADGDEILRRLLFGGLKVNYPLRRKILNYISLEEPERVLHCATSTGWHSPETFVLPDEIIGTNDVWFQSAIRVADYGRAGTLESWQSEIAAYATGNPYLMFSLSFALCGLLLERLAMTGLGVHFYGDSTIGKTSNAYAAASLWGHGERYLRTWRTTANGLEGIAVQHTDTLLVLDEIANIGARDLNEVAYFLTDGQGKTRANKYGEARVAAQWRIALLSSGEQSIRAKLLEGGLSAKTGQGLRILDVPATLGKYGIFDQLHGHPNGAVLADSIRRSSCEHYRHAGPAFIQSMIAHPVDQLAAAHQKILQRYGNLKDQERRAARTFALAGLAGELAVKAGILPWKEADALLAAHHMFTIWCEARSINEIGSEQLAILRAVRDFIERHGESRFSSISGRLDTDPIVRDRAGYWDDSTNPRSYLFNSSGLREVTKGYDLKRVLQALDQAGSFTEKGYGNERAKKRNLPDGTEAKLYHINPAKLD